MIGGTKFFKDQLQEGKRSAGDCPVCGKSLQGMQAAALTCSPTCKKRRQKLLKKGVAM